MDRNPRNHSMPPATPGSAARSAFHVPSPSAGARMRRRARQGGRMPVRPLGPLPAPMLAGHAMAQCNHAPVMHPPMMHPLPNQLAVSFPINGQGPTVHVPVQQVHSASGPAPSRASPGAVASPRAPEFLHSSHPHDGVPVINMRDVNERVAAMQPLVPAFALPLPPKDKKPEHGPLHHTVHSLVCWRPRGGLAGVPFEPQVFVKWHGGGSGWVGAEMAIVGCDAAKRRAALDGVPECMCTDTHMCRACEQVFREQTFGWN